MKRAFYNVSNLSHDEDMSDLAPHVPNVLDNYVSVIGDSEHIGHLPSYVETDSVILVSVSDMDSADNLSIDASKEKKISYKLLQLKHKNTCSLTRKTHIPDI